MVRRLPLLLLAPLAAILLTGCLRIDIAMRVAEDGSGTVSILSAIDGSAMAALGALGGGAGAPDLASMFTAPDASRLPPGASAEPYQDGTFVGARATVPFASTDDVAATLGALMGNAGDAGALVGADGLFESLVLESDGDGWIFEAQFPRDMAAAAAGAEGGAALDPALLAPLLGEAAFTIRIALPGTVVEHNADRVEGDELIWDLDILDPGARPLMARTELGGGEGLSPALVVVAAVVVLAAAAGGVWVVRRRRGG